MTCLTSRWLLNPIQHYHELMKNPLVIDARMIGPFGHGIAKYVEGIAGSLKDGDALTDTLVKSMGAKTFADVEPIFIVAPDCPKSSPVYKFKTVKSEISTYHPKSWLEIPKILKSLKADLFFNPTFASFPYLPCKFVQTVHDLNHLHFGNFAQKLYYQTLLKPSLRQAEWIFTVSEAVKKELVDWAKTDPNKIKVFYNRFDEPLTVSANTTLAILDHYQLKPHQYFFCIANDKPHKNTEMLISAHRNYSRGQMSNDAVTNAWTEAFKENSAQSGNRFPLVLTLPKAIGAPEDAIKRVGNVNDETLAVLLKNCAGFYFPSLYEGFGRPPVEAAMSGVSFIAVSDIPVHHEAEKLSSASFRFVRVTV